MYGYKDVRIMNGGRKKWLAESRELTKEVPSPEQTTFRVLGFDETFRAFLRQV